MLKWLLIGSITLSSCNAGGSPSTAAPAPTSTLPTASAPLATAKTGATAKTSNTGTTQATPKGDWREAARSLRYGQAAQLLAQLPASRLSQAEHRLAYGVTSLYAGDGKQALRSLANLESELPALAKELRQWRRTAMATVGPFEDAANAYLKSPQIGDAIRAAEALLRGKKFKAAQTVADQCVKRCRRNRLRYLEQKTRWLRARIAVARGRRGEAEVDWRWLLAKHPASQHAREALAQLDKGKGRVSLALRLRVLAQTTRVANLQATLATFDRLAAKTGKGPLWHRMQAKALYGGRDYARAVSAFDRAARKNPNHSAECRYYAARAATRSLGPAAALKRYAWLERHLGKSRWRERAAYRRGELLLQLGKDAAAARSFSRYLSRYGKSKSAGTVRYFQALAVLGSNRPKRALKLLRTLQRKSKERRFKASLQQLEGVAAFAAGQQSLAKKLWKDLIRKQPLTWPALAAQARLRAASSSATMMPAVAPRATPPPTAALPKAVALLASVGLHQDAEKKLASMEDQVTAPFPGREGEVLCSLYGKLAPARRRARVGNRSVALKLLLRPPSSSQRWAWDCVYPQAFPDLVRKEEAANNLPHGLVYAIMRQESAFKTTAVSRVGARGLMQLMPYTAKAIAGEIKLELNPSEVKRPDVNIKLGAYYLAKLLKTFDGSLPLAVAAYNAGPGAVRSWLLHNKGLEADLWVARIPYRETRHYVRRVLANLSRYQWLSKGNSGLSPFTLKLPRLKKVGDNEY